MSAADWLSASRLLLVGLLWPVALAGDGRLLGVGLIVAALTDILDGYMARRLHRASVRGAKLDAAADSALMVSTAIWLAVLHPTLVTDNATLLAMVATVWTASTAASYLTLGRLVDARQASAKLAGGLLYAFALVTLLIGAYEPMLLGIALLALGASSLEGLLKAIRTIHASGIASSARSHRPQASNGDASSAAASTSIATSATPATRQTAP
jgi:phosphatidylglycerophosphate synthase